MAVEMALTVEETVMKFGSSQKAFSLVIVKKLAKSEKLEYKEKVNSIIKYLSKHFAKITGGRILEWNTIDKSFDILAVADFKNTLTGCGIFGKKKIKKENGDEVSKLTVEKVADIFLEKCEFMFTKIDCDVMKSRVWIDEPTGGAVINTFKGFKWGEYEVEDVDVTENGIPEFFDFLKNVMCSGNEGQFQFFKKWIIMTVNGQKCVQFAWMQGPQGVGKSKLWEIIRDYVLGRDAVLILDNYKIILPGEFNTKLEGKVLIVFEELGDADKMKGTSHQVEQAFKNFTNPDNPYIEINQKYRDMRTIVNYANIAFNTNNSPFSSSRDDRRHFIPDIDGTYAKNRDYFGKLTDACCNDEFGWAFWCYCKKEYEKMTKKEITQFINSEPPESKRRAEKHGASLKMWKRFLKEEYVMKKMDLDGTKKDIYERFKRWADTNGTKGVPAMSIFFGMDHMGSVIGEDGSLIQQYKKYEKAGLRLKASFDDLLAYAQKNHWLEDGEEPYDVDLDEIDPDDDKEWERQLKEAKEKVDDIKRRMGYKLAKDMKQRDAPMAGGIVIDE